MLSYPIHFTKMHGSGNDFVVIDNRRYQQPLDFWIEQTPLLCDRKYGIGGDGLLVLDTHSAMDIPGADYTMIYRNADGSDAGMCGNGGRCMALFASLHGFEQKHAFNVHDSLYHAEVLKSDDEYKVQITFPQEVEITKADGIEADGLFCYPGTEHVTIETEDLSNREALRELAQSIRYNKEAFPKGTNVNFYRADSENDAITLLTYERGVEDYTLACGTGALATGISAHHNHQVNSPVTINVDGGPLRVHFKFVNKRYHDLILEGPATTVYEGEIEL